jgi:hypothetical protein
VREYLASGERRKHTMWMLPRRQERRFPKTITTDAACESRLRRHDGDRRCGSSPPSNLRNTTAPSRP